MEPQDLSEVIRGLMNLRKTGILVSIGGYINEIQIIDQDKELFKNGIFFTQRQLEEALINDGVLFIREMNQEGLLSIELQNRGVHFRRVSDDQIAIRVLIQDVQYLLNGIIDLQQHFL